MSREGKVFNTDTTQLIEYVSMFPTLSNWGILVFSNKVIVFAEKGRTFEQGLIDDTGDLDMSLLRKIPLALIVPEPRYFSIPIMKATHDFSFNAWTEDANQNFICSQLPQLKNWGVNNVIAMKSHDTSKILFQTSNSITYFNPVLSLPQR